MVDSLEREGWSYNLISPQITDLDLENLQINQNTRDNIIKSIHNEFR
jgi:hypothetical protein